MSKSLDNYVGITEAPSEIFGKLMSISDELMWRYYELLSFRPSEDIAKLEARVRRRPQPARRQSRARTGDRRALPLAGGGGEGAVADFEARFRQGALPDDHAGGSSCRPTAPACRSPSSQSRRASSNRRPRRSGSSRQKGMKVDGDVIGDKALVVPRDERSCSRRASASSRDQGDVEARGRGSVT
jgi:tyrosyl-tRNA synthetase